MDFLLGIQYDEGVLLAADCGQARSIVVMKHDMDKGIKVAPNMLMLTSGPVGDCVAFGEYISKNIKLNELRNGVVSSPWSNANFIRTQLATALRSRSPYNVNMLLGGFGAEGTEHSGAQLYFVDYLSAMTRVPFAAQGYGAFFTLSILDKHYRSDLNKEEAIVLIKRCIAEVQKRFMVNMPAFKLRVVDKDGINDLELDI